MIFKIKLVVILFFAFNFALNAQVELNTVTPLSPNAAAITKYGEIPVGHFTGAAHISIPLYTIQSKDLLLPLSLSYHGGGIKVEENASWVGLGWSLGNIPTISRQVNGLPDEVGGYNSTITYDGYSMKKIEDSLFYGSSNPYWTENFRRKIYEGYVDPEADIYFFSLPNKSGKFWWNQESSSFETYPKSAIKIEGSSTFSITDEDGTIYIFNDFETSQTSGSNVGPTIKSAWYASKIYNSNRTDSIDITYKSELATSLSIAPYSYTIFGSCPTSNLGNNNSISLKLPDSIKFSNGYIKFTKQSTSREDYSGGYALDNMKIYTNSNVLIKRYDLTYHYMQSGDGSTLCNNAPSYEKKRLMLNKIKLVDINDVTAQQHSFLYDSIITSPCKVSTAQDYWGFYNGKLSNLDLIPKTTVSLPGGPVEVGSADRNVNSSYSQFGILRRINYPTGGYSDFEYENNTSGNNPSLPISTTFQYVSLQGEAPDPITTNIYVDTFLIDNIPNIHLNGGFGGAYLYAQIGEYGCDLSGGGSSCASFTIRGIDVGNSSYFGTVLPNNTQGWYVPNGKYEIKASFNQNPPDYDEFYFTVKWKVLDPLELDQAYNRKVGGVRIKKISSLDKAGQSITQNYRYNTFFNSDTSSGEIFGRPHFVVIDNTWETGGGQCTSLHADPNAITVTHAGSYVGYKSVFELVDTSGNKGMSEYQFTTAAEGIVSSTPYPPAESQEYARGLPVLVANFKQFNGDFIPVKRTYSEYLLKTYDSLKSVSYKLKVVKPPNQAHPLQMGWWEDAFYYTTPMWSGISKLTEKVYDQNDTLKFAETVTNYTYNQDNQLTKTEYFDSKGKSVTAMKYYPKDITLSGSAETARQALVAQNNISVVLKQEQKKEGNLLSEVKTNYKHFGSLVMPEEIFQKIGSGSLESRIKFNNYSIEGNLTSQQKTNDLNEVFLWGYNNQYPVAKIIGSELAIASSFISQNIINNISITDSDMRLELNKIRTGLGSTIAQVTTYTYKLLVGITSETDPNGRTTYYEYDSFNRLSIIRDNDKKIIKKICYNYNNQPEDCTSPTVYSNDIKTGMFTKNNCTGCSVGSQVTYTVQAGTYTSAIDKATANALAQTDVDNNGQTYANTNGTCTNFTGINITYSNTSNETGFTAYYTNLSTDVTYTFNIPASGSGTLGCIPSGNYSLVISKTPAGITPILLFGSGCSYISGGFSATFPNLSVTTKMGGCRNITIEPDL